MMIAPEMAASDGPKKERLLRQKSGWPKRRPMLLLETSVHKIDDRLRLTGGFRMMTAPDWQLLSDCAAALT